MKTRTLFLTLITSISILLIAQGFAFADSITGCLQKSTGKIYNAQIGSEQPTLPCGMFDEVITWSEEGPAGADGADGQDGVDGQDGIDGERGPAGPPGAPQFILKDSTGAQVGTVVTVNDDWESFIVRPPDAGVLVKTNRSVLTAIDIQKANTTTATVAISVDRLNIHFQHRALFKDFGCTVPVGESPLTKEFIVDVDFPPAFTMPAVVVGVPGQPDVRKLYVQTEGESSEIREHFSLLIGSDCIDRPVDDPVIVPSISMELIDDDLHQTFPGPYTLEGPAGAGGTIIHQVHLEDSNNPNCEATGGIPGDPTTAGWCPNDTLTSFFIREPLVTEKSVVMTTGVFIPGSGIGPSSCIVFLVNPTVPGFRINCSIASDGSVLNYAVIP